MIDLDTLNREQLQAVLCTEGPLLVLAGAGSGKTRVITYRLAHLIRNGVSPSQILCVTFTNKAAYEMRTRARKLVGKSLRGATMSTFHALGARILRDDPARAGLRPGFTITDGGEQLGTVRRILRDLRIDDRKFDVKKIMSMISKAKNAGIEPDLFREQGGFQSFDDDPDDDYMVATIESYERYQGSLRAQNVIDFDDLLLITQRLLTTDEELRTRLQERWQYLMIDEYQDTNGSQFSMMKTLAGERRNLCVVGDDDQSIYGWRGADVTNILRFNKDFPGAEVIKLETNYRSTGHILSVANSVIEKNSQRHDKRLRPYAGPGDPVLIVAMADEEDEAELIAKEVFGLISSGVAANEIAVLFRSNVQSRTLELAFRPMGISYRVAGGQELFDKKEIKDFLAYLRLLDNIEDEQSLRRIVNFPPRGIGSTTLERIDTWAREQHISLYEGLQRAYDVEGITAKAADNVAAFTQLIDEHRKALGRRKVSTAANRLLDDIKLMEVLWESSDNLSAASRRVDNIKELVKQIERYETRIRRKQDKTAPEELDDNLFPDALDDATLTGFLADMALGAREDGTTEEDRKDQVLLSTIHAAKGLEWDHVFLVGAEEDLLPHRRTIDIGNEVEEERRLAYVAVTRARKHLTVTWAKNRTKWGQIVPRTRSRFMEDLPEDSVRLTEDDIVRERTDEEKDAIAEKYMADIRQKLGL